MNLREVDTSQLVHVQSSPTHAHVQSSPTHAHVQSSPTHVHVQSSPTHVHIQSSLTHVHLQSSLTHVHMQSSSIRVPCNDSASHSACLCKCSRSYLPLLASFSHHSFNATCLTITACTASFLVVHTCKRKSLFAFKIGNGVIFSGDCGNRESQI